MVLGNVYKHGPGIHEENHLLRVCQGHFLMEGVFEACAPSLLYLCLLFVHPLMLIGKHCGDQAGLNRVKLNQSNKPMPSYLS